MKVNLSSIHTEPFVLQREWEADGIPILSASVSLPRPSVTGNGIFRRIRRFYELQARSYLRYCERWLFPEAVAAYHTALSSSSPLPHFQAKLSYCVTYNKDGFWSLYTQSDETDSSGDTFFCRHGDTWDLAAGYPVSLGSFFPSHFRWRSNILSMVSQKIQQQIKSRPSAYHEGWQKLLRRHFNPRNYYLTPDGIAIFFPMYSISPQAEKIPVFLLPYKNLPYSLPRA